MTIRTTALIRTSPRRSSGVLRFAHALVGLTLVASSSVFALSANGSTTTASINESNNGKVVTVAKGSHLTVTLHNTYWTIAPLAKQTVLVQQGPVVTTPRLPGSVNGCVPGQGCGTVVAHYLATGAGSVRIRASRTSCGEAMRCTPSQGHWTVVIRVR